MGNVDGTIFLDLWLLAIALDARHVSTAKSAEQETNKTLTSLTGGLLRFFAARLEEDVLDGQTGEDVDYFVEAVEL